MLARRYRLLRFSGEEFDAKEVVGELGFAGLGVETPAAELAALVNDYAFRPGS